MYAYYFLTKRSKSTFSNMLVFRYAVSLYLRLTHLRVTLRSISITFFRYKVSISLCLFLFLPLSLSISLSLSPSLYFSLSLSLSLSLSKCLTFPHLTAYHERFRSCYIISCKLFIYMCVCV